MSTPFEPVEVPGHYAKAFVAVATAVLAVLVTAATDNVVSTSEVLGIAVAFLTAVGVYFVPNLSGSVGRYAKAIVAVLGTAVQAAVPLVDGGWTTTSWLLVVLAALGALTVGIAPNAKSYAERSAGHNIVIDVPGPAIDEE